MLGRSVTFGPKSVEKRPQQENFFELTTPNSYNKKLQFSFFKIQLTNSIDFPYTSLLDIVENLVLVDQSLVSGFSSKSSLHCTT